MSSERHLCKEACEHCGKPVYADEGYHGVSMDHYSCHKGVIAKFEESAKKLDGIFEDLGVKPKRARDGTGKVAQKALKRAVEAIERATEGKVVKTLVWNQQGRYRGPKWDLAAWGVDFELQFEGDEKTYGGSLACWATMTAVSKLETLTIFHDGPTFNFEA